MIVGPFKDAKNKKYIVFIVIERMNYTKLKKIKKRKES